MEIYATKNEIINAMESSVPLSVISMKLTLMSSAKAMAPMVGIAKRKLNLEAAVALSPRNKPAVMVIPDLDVPGIKARH